MGLSVENLRPLEDRLVIRMLQPDEEVLTSAGLVLPKTAHEKTMFGRVIKAGLGRIAYGGEFYRCECEKDDVVLVGKMAGTDFVLSGIKYLVIREADVMIRFPKEGGKFHLSDERETTGVDDHFKRAQLPAKVPDRQGKEA